MGEDSCVPNMFRGTSTQLLGAVFGTLFAISDGMMVGWTAPMIPYLISENSHIKTTKHEAEYLEPVLLLGAFCGLPTTMYFTQKIGRKKSIILASIVELITWILIGFGDSITYIFVARFMAGMAGNMAFVSAPMYIAEIANQKIRGFLSSIIYLMMLLGCLVVYVVGPYLPYYASPVIGASMVILELSIFSFVPETPYYLLWKGKPEKAKTSLQYYRPGVDIAEELKSITDAINKHNSENGTLKDLLTGGNRKSLIIMAVLAGGQNMCAIHVVLMNLHLILSEAGVLYLTESLTGVIFSVIMLVMASISSFQVDKHGRKILIIISSISTGICLLILAIYFNLKNTGHDMTRFGWVPVVVVMAYAACFKGGLGIVPIVITAEIFATNVKAVGMTIADAMYVIWGIVSLQMYQWLEEPFGMHVPFYIFSVCGFLLAGFTAFYIPETKGKTLDEIQDILNGTHVQVEMSPVEVPLMTQKV